MAPSSYSEMPWYTGYSGPVPDDNPASVPDFEDIVPAVRWYCRFFAEQEHPLGYFAALYGKVSEEIETAMAAGSFVRPELFKAMDVRFATRYLQAMDAYLHRREGTRVWQVVVESSQYRKVTVMQHLLAALNAHVNLDLPVAAAQAAPGARIHEFEADFKTINEVLYGLMETVQRDLGEVFWLLRWWNRLMGRMDNSFFRVGLVGARSLAWQQAVQLAEASEKERLRLEHLLDRRFAPLGRRILFPRNPITRLGMWWVRRHESGTVSHKIQKLVD